jgi:ABC transport system ATP-binding/permease protein
VIADHGTMHVGIDGRTFPVLPGHPALLGRSPDADVVLTDLRVSRRHLQVAHEPDRGWVVKDLGSSGGTYHDGARIDRLTVSGPLELRLGHPVHGVAITVTPASAALEPQPSAGEVDAWRALTQDRTSEVGRSGVEGAAELFDAATEQLRADEVSHEVVGRNETTVGRAPDNDVVIEDLLVSRHHAVVRKLDDGNWEVEDLGSANGTYVAGVSVDRATLTDGEVFSVARQAVRLRGGRLHLDVGDGVPALQCEQVEVTLRGGHHILQPISFRAESGTLIAVLGPTGAGKSTLLKALTGGRAPSDGTVLIQGRDLHAAPDAIRPLLGYVPQDDILHPQLTVRRALTYAAELRLPPDVGPDEIARRVGEVMEELGLAERADVRVSQLSGGQRKRTSVALELLTAPAVLLLDEPTSGLDPGYEKSVMRLLRDLADAGRTVVVVTHSVQSLDLCDRVLFLASGGRAAYLGPPSEALAAFGRADYADAFYDLERWEGPPVPLPPGPARRLSDEHELRSGAPDPRDPADRDHWRRQLLTLVRRQCAVLAADRRVLLFLVASGLVLGLLILAVVDAGALDPDGPLPSTSARTLLGAVVIAAVTIGVANTVREVVKEQAIFARERAAGVSDTAYLAAKVLVFGSITAVQAVLLVLVATSTAGGPVGSAFLLPGRLELIAGVVLAALGAATLGLLLSSLVSSSEKAMTLIPVVFIVQWLLSGMALDLADTPVMRPVSYVTSANWGMAAAASTADLSQLELACEHAPPTDAPETASADAAAEGTEGAPDPSAVEDERPCDARWQRGPWRWLGNVTALSVIAVLPLGAVVVRLQRRGLG